MIQNAPTHSGSFLRFKKCLEQFLPYGFISIAGKIIDRRYADIIIFVFNKAKHGLKYLLKGVIREMLNEDRFGFGPSRASC